ncbi:hypothetical protein Dimus_019629 [Dionaea muscipula]
MVVSSLLPPRCFSLIVVRKIQFQPFPGSCCSSNISSKVTKRAMSLSSIEDGCNSSLPLETNAGTGKETPSHGGDDDILVQYVVLRRDLVNLWPLGSVVTQGCHAAVAAVWCNKDDPCTLQYCSPGNLDSMHKVTLEVKGETQILNLSEKLKAGGIAHKLWIEQPENIPTCLATKPYPKSTVSSFFKKLKLCK